MRSPKKWVPVVLVVGTIALGIALIVVSLSANRVRWDRDTVLAAAEYDGTALWGELLEMPATSIDFVEKDSGPSRTDATMTKEAWASWRQTFSSREDFPAICEWHRSRLQSREWISDTDGDIEKTSFSQGEWTFSVTRLPDGSAPTPLRFRCELNWHTTVP